MVLYCNKIARKCSHLRRSRIIRNKKASMHLRYSCVTGCIPNSLGVLPKTVSTSLRVSFVCQSARARPSVRVSTQNLQSPNRALSLPVLRVGRSGCRRSRHLVLQPCRRLTCGAEPTEPFLTHSQCDLPCS